MRKNNTISTIGRIHEKANRFIVRELEEHGIEGIVPSHGSIFWTLFAEGPCTMKELAEKIHRTKPTVTVLVDKLVDYGYVAKEKSPEDNRVTYISLTEKGLSLKPSFEEISQKLNQRVYSGLTEREAEVLESTLQRIESLFPG